MTRITFFLALILLGACTSPLPLEPLTMEEEIAALKEDIAILTAEIKAVREHTNAQCDKIEHLQKEMDDVREHHMHNKK